MQTQAHIDTWKAQQGSAQHGYGIKRTKGKKYKTNNRRKESAGNYAEMERCLMQTLKDLRSRESKWRKREFRTQRAKRRGHT